MKFPGFRLGEVWAKALNLDVNSKAWPVVKHVYQNVIDHVRLMVKFEEWEKIPEAHTQALARIERAREIGVPIMLCIDWFNSWWGLDPKDTSNYHKYTYKPRDGFRSAVRQILREIGKDGLIALQVANEPYARDPIGTAGYATRVYQYVRGANDVDLEVFLLAEQSRKDRGDVRKAWEWHVGYNEKDPDALIVPWDWGCCEGKHREPRVLHTLTSPEALSAALHSNYWSDRRRPRGWRWPVWHDEVAPVGKEVHINTETGAQMMLVALRFFDEHKAPMTYLTMDGYTENWGSDDNSGWGMNPGLVNKHGQLSLGAKAIYDYLGKELPEEPGNGNGDPPLDPMTGHVDWCNAVWHVSRVYASGGGVEDVIEDEYVQQFYRAWMEAVNK